MITVVWLCYFSNEEVRLHLNLKFKWYERLYRYLRGLSTTVDKIDIADWNTKAIREIKTHPEIKLHVISPCSYLASKKKCFNIDGVHYHFFDNEEVWLSKRLITKFSKKPYMYKHNRATISGILSEIKPDIIHIIGAENPFYSLAILDFPKEYKTLVQLQTLLADPKFDDNYPISKDRLEYLRSVEEKVILKADYVGTTVQHFNNIINDRYGNKVAVVPTSLALSEKIIKNDDSKKEFDFVYFALDISKAADLAIDSFAKAKEKEPSITLDIVGGFTKEYKEQLDEQLITLSISDSVFFEGRLETHDDVLKQIRKSRFALLPLKADMVSGTIREAMANGLPVVTTITEGTPKLNKEKKCVMLSRTDDIEGIAQNMCLLLENDSLAEELRDNSFAFIERRESNKKVVDDYIRFYHSISQS